MNEITISVIIPTFNRAAKLAVTLEALVHARFDLNHLEVVVVDDGSSDNTSEIQNNSYPFSLHYLKQVNQGDAIARNNGAIASRGDLLIFLDDDISVTFDLLTLIQKTHGGRSGVIVIGTLIPANMQNFLQDDALPAISESKAIPLAFTECHSGIQAIQRMDFMRLGMMQPLEVGGWSIWSDVEFAYRAEKAGFIFLKCMNAIGYHHDYAQQSLQIMANRMYRVARAGVLLFHRHPQLITHLPMFLDKTPIQWQNDKIKLILRKMARRMASSLFSIKLLEWLHRILTSSNHASSLCEMLEIWIIGSYIYRGYQQGLREYGPPLPNPDLIAT